MKTCSTYRRDAAQIARAERLAALSNALNSLKNAVSQALTGAGYCITRPLAFIFHGTKARVIAPQPRAERKAPMKLRTGKSVLTLITAASLAASSAMAQSATRLEDDAETWERLFITAAANEIRENCDTIEARKVAATFYVLGIVRHAKSLGFTMEQIDAFRFDEKNQDRLRQRTYAWLDENGVDRSARTGYCALGDAEIAKNSPIGKLLKRG